MMTATEQHKEIEVKFYLNDPGRFVNRLKAAGAQLKIPRTYEHDLRFDDNARSLQMDGRILRLRLDRQASLTYKGPGELIEGVSVRQEIEVGVSDFNNTRKVLEALGYKLVFSYEKYRTTYLLTQCEVDLDEMPYGWFCEIEGASSQSIQSTAEKLNLSWDARIVDSYAMLFRRCMENRKLGITDLTFTNFKALRIVPQDLGVCPADVD